MARVWIAKHEPLDDTVAVKLVRILDFGIARERVPRARKGRRHTTGRGVVLGTPQTMSPEQARGERVDMRADVWSLACCAYESLTGKPIVDGETPEACVVNLL